MVVTETEVGEPFTRRHASGPACGQGAQDYQWRAEDGVANMLPQSPVTSDQAEEEVTLIPYAAAKFRITAFPILKM